MVLSKLGAYIQKSAVNTDMQTNHEDVTSGVARAPQDGRRNAARVSAGPLWSRASKTLPGAPLAYKYLRVL